MNKLNEFNQEIKKKLLSISDQYTDQNYNILVARPAEYHPKNQIKRTRWLWNIAIGNKKARPSLTYLLIKLNSENKIIGIYAVPPSVADKRKTAVIYENSSKSWISKYKIG